jgi:hypothetical protein
VSPASPTAESNVGTLLSPLSTTTVTPGKVKEASAMGDDTITLQHRRANKGVAEQKKTAFNVWHSQRVMSM